MIFRAEMMTFKKLLSRWLRETSEVLRVSNKREVWFEHVAGREVPCQPWPQSFWISSFCGNQDMIELRPLTLGGLLRGLGKNFITMNYWHFMRLLWVMGFLNTEEAEIFSWSQWNWHPLRTRARRKTEKKWVEKCLKEGRPPYPWLNPK